MAASERILFQPYTAGKRGALKPGQSVSCRTPEEGMRRAEKAIAGGQVVGAHVVRVMADEEVGDYGELEFLAAFGTVPESE
jgi:hypothetical protein